MDHPALRSGHAWRIVIVCGGNYNFCAITFYIIRFAKENKNVSLQNFILAFYVTLSLLTVVHPFLLGIGNYSFPVLLLSSLVGARAAIW